MRPDRLWWWVVPVLAGMVSRAAAAAPPPRLASPPRPMRAVWVSPDWLVDPSDPHPTAGKVRDHVEDVLDRLGRLGVDTLFLEVFLRGYFAGVPRALAPADRPIYPLLAAGDGPIDLVEVVLEAARPRGVAVHGWFHAFYWKTDNLDLVRPFHEGPTVFDRLLASHLDAVAPGLPGAADRELLAGVSGLLDGRGYRDRDLADLLTRGGLDPSVGPLQALMTRLSERGAPPPAFLLCDPGGQVHPEPRKDHWLAMYLDPRDPAVREILLRSIQGLAQSYPDLAGLHLDHVRYPTGAHGIPDGSGDLRPGVTLTGARRSWMARWRELRTSRETAVGELVREARARLGTGQLLSAAVHPMYYHHREDWESTLAPEDFIGQDWMGWNLDFVVPMTYGSDVARIGRILKRLRFGLLDRRGPGHGIGIHPGTDRLGLVGPRSPLPSWCYFDFGQFPWHGGSGGPGGRPVRSGREGALQEREGRP